MFPAPVGRAFEIDPLDRTRRQELQCHLLDLLILLDSSLDFGPWPFVLDIFKSPQE